MMQGREVAAWVVAAVGFGVAIGAFVNAKRPPAPIVVAAPTPAPSSPAVEILLEMEEERHRARIVEATRLVQVASTDRSAGHFEAPFYNRQDLVGFFRTAWGLRWARDRRISAAQLALVETAPFLELGAGFRVIDITGYGRPVVLRLAPELWKQPEGKAITPLAK